MRPEMVEDGVRNILADGLRDEHHVAKRGIEYMGTRDITWDMKIEHLAPLGKKLTPSDMKKAIQKNAAGGRK